MNRTLFEENVYLSLVDEGATLFEQGNHLAAHKCFLKAFQMHPESPITLFNLGRSLEELRDIRSIDFYEAAVSMGSVNASYQLATIYSQNSSPGYKEATIRHLNLYLNNTRDTDECLQWAKQRLNELAPAPSKPVLVWSKGKRVA
jgi:tetratricopeptide (TPR) repeat protein